MYNQYKVIGFRTYDFKNNEGNQVAGTTLYLTQDDRDNVTGLYCESRNITAYNMNRFGYIPIVGDTIELIWTSIRKNGQELAKLDGIRLVKENAK